MQFVPDTVQRTSRFTAEPGPTTTPCEGWAPDQRRTTPQAWRAAQHPGHKRSAADIGADDVAEPLPGFALEPHQLKLGKRGKVGGAGIDLDPGQQATELKPSYVGRLPHDVLAREIVATLLQYVDQRLGNCVAVNNRSIRAICFREVFVQEFIPGLHSRIVLPLRIRWVLEVSLRDDALCVFHAVRLDHA